MPSLKFSETMTGFFLENTDDPERGHEIGNKRKNKIGFRITITIDDMNAFINDPNHEAKLDGVIDYGRIDRIVELFGSMEVLNARDLSEKKDTVSKFMGFVNRELEATYSGPGHFDLFDVLKFLRLI